MTARNLVGFDDTRRRHGQRLCNGNDAGIIEDYGFLSAHASSTRPVPASATTPW